MKGIAKQVTDFRFGLHKLQVLREILVVPHNGRTYKLVEVQTNEGQRYLCIRLYDNKGEFIKQLLLDQEVAGDIGQALSNVGSNHLSLAELKRQAVQKALDSLARYKFMMFGYWSAIWVYLNQIDIQKEANPFKKLVQKAREMQEVL